MRTARGFHKALGGIAKRRREILTEIATGKVPCHLHRKRPRLAVGIVVNALNQPFPVCDACIRQGQRLGYEVERPSISAGIP